MKTVISHKKLSWLVAAACLVLLAQPSAYPAVEDYRILVNSHPALTHQYTFEGTSPLADKKGTSPVTMYPAAGSLPDITAGFDLLNSTAIRFTATNGLVNTLAAGDANAVYLGTNFSFEIIFRVDESNSTAPDNGGVAKLSWLLSTRSDDNNQRGYLLFQGQPYLLPVAGDGSGLTSVMGNAFNGGNNSNRVAEAVVAGHWYYVAGSHDTDLVAQRTTWVNYIADLTAGQTTLTRVGPHTNDAGSYAPVGHTRFGIGTRYDGLGFARYAIEEVDLYCSNALSQVTFQSHLNALVTPPTLLITSVGYNANQDQLTLVWNSLPGAIYTIENT